MILRLLPLAFLALGSQLLGCIGTVQGGEDALEDDLGGAGAASSGGGGSGANGSSASGNTGTGGAATGGGAQSDSSGGATSTNAGGGSANSSSSGGGSSGTSTGSDSGGATGTASSTGSSTTGSTGTEPSPIDAGVDQDAGSEDLDAGSPLDPIEQSITRGAGIYPAMCAGCHGADGSGGPVREPLTSFTSVPQLSAIIDREMPPGNPNACSATCAEDVARYIIATF